MHWKGGVVEEMVLRVRQSWQLVMWEHEVVGGPRQPFWRDMPGWHFVHWLGIVVFYRQSRQFPPVHC